MRVGVSSAITMVFLLCSAFAGEEDGVAEAEVRVGDPGERVRHVLGTPRGYLKAGNSEMLLFARGRVRLRDGVVVDVELVSQEEADARERERAEQQRLRAAQMHEQRLALLEEGAVVRAEKRSDTAFRALAADKRVAFWREFMRRYPGVDVAVDLASAVQEAEADALEIARERELAELRRQVVRAEVRAEEAEERAKWEAEQSRRRFSYPVVTSGGVTYIRPLYVGGHVVGPYVRPRNPVIVPTAYGQAPYIYQRDFYSYGSGQSGSARVRHDGLVIGVDW